MEVCRHSPQLSRPQPALRSRKRELVKLNQAKQTSCLPAAAIHRVEHESEAKTMPEMIEDLRIQWTKIVLPPVFLEEERPTTDVAEATVFNARFEISRILARLDSRLLVLVGPCSIHDTAAAREYGALLKAAIAEFSQDLRIVMRVYFEK